MADDDIGGLPLSGTAGASAGLQQVLNLLISPSPEVLTRTAAVLSSVVAEMKAWRNTSATPAAISRVEIERIRSLATRAAALLAKAYNFHAGWNAYLASRTGGYQAGGDPAPLSSPGRVWAEG
jgi:hypothetical protein